MLNNLIILSVILCLIILLITLYYLYNYYRKKKVNEKELKQENASPKIIEELMRKSFEFAKTAEKVADKNEKRLTLEENIHF
jgi:predicted Holliday junction resolvase-like endonuclease